MLKHLAWLAVLLPLAAVGQETQRDERFVAEVAVEYRRSGGKPHGETTFRSSLLSDDASRLSSGEKGFAEITTTVDGAIVHRLRGDVTVEAIANTSPRQYRSEVRLREGEATVGVVNLTTLEGQPARVETSDGQGGSLSVSIVISRKPETPAPPAPPKQPEPKPLPKHEPTAKRDTEPRRDSQEVEERIRATLATPVAAIGFRDVELRNAISQIRSLANVNIVVDDAALQEEGLTFDTRVDLAHLEYVRLQDALTLLLEPRNLTYVVENEVLKITSKSRAAGPLTVEVYQVADLLVPLSIPILAAPADRKANASIEVDVPRRLEFDSLVELITGSIQPNTWEQVGGQGVIRGNETTLSLVVRQTPNVHAEIGGLLSQLRKLKIVQGTISLETALLRLQADEVRQLEKMFRLTPRPNLTYPLGPEHAERMRTTAPRLGPASETLPVVTLLAGEEAKVAGVAFEGNTAFNWRIALRPEVVAGRAIRLTPIDSSGPTGEEPITVGDGQAVLIDVTPKVGKVPGTDPKETRLLLLVTPRILRQTEHASDPRIERVSF